MESLQVNHFEFAQPTFSLYTDINSTLKYLT